MDMTQVFKRSFLSVLLALVMVLPLSSLNLVPFASATTTPGQLVINEINWAGSSSNPNDQWVELYNNSSLPAIGDFVLSLNGTTMTDMPSLNLPANNYMVLCEDPTSTDLLPGVCNSNYPLGSLPTGVSNIGSGQLQLSLISAGISTVVDTAGVTSRLPLSGNDGTSGLVISSMNRRYQSGQASDGTLSTGWSPSQVIGKNFKPGTIQYGTPGEADTYVAPATNAMLVSDPTSTTPLDSAELDKTLYLTGTINTASAFIDLNPIPATSVLASISMLSGNTYKPYLTLPSVAVQTTGVNTTFQIKIPANTVTTTGSYAFSLQTEDKNGDYSPWTAVMIGKVSLGINNPFIFYTPLSAPVVTSTSTCNLSKLNSCYTNLTSMVISGLTDQDTQSVQALDVNNKIINTSDTLGTTPTAGAVSFSVMVTLTPNVQNVLKIQATQKLSGLTSETPIYINQVSQPPVINQAELKITPSSDYSSSQISGAPGSITSPLLAPLGLLTIYADSALTQPIITGQIQADGSFSLTVPAADVYLPNFYLKVSDAAGNLSTLALKNTVTFAEGNVQVNFSFNDISSSQVNVVWNPVTGAADYLLKYEVAGGTYSNPVSLCNGVATGCVLQRQLVGLKANAVYSVAIAAVDANGVPSSYNAQDFQTLPTPVTTVTTVSSSSTATTSTTSASTVLTSTPAPTPSATPVTTTQTVSPVTSAATKATPTPTPQTSPTPTATPESGQVKSANTSKTSTNWGPWLIIGILLLLIILATTGYFYWFGGEAGEETLAAVLAEKEAKLDVKNNNSTPAKSEKPVKESSPKKDEKEKRW
jgi:hypothetical protein